MLVKSFGSKAVVEASINSATLRILRNVPGKTKWSGASLIFEPTPDALKYLQLSVPDIKWSDCIQPALDAALYLDLHRKAGAPVSRPLDFQFKTKPFEHQLRLFLMSRDQEAFALFMEQGTGKTKSLLDTAAWQWSQGKIDGLLVIAPNGVHRNWVDNEIPAHLPDWVNHKAAWWKAPSSAGKKHNETWDAAAHHDGLSILCANIETFSHAHIAKLFKGWLGNRRVMTVVDESTCIKEPTAACTKNVLKFGEMSVTRRIATGTPASEGPLGLYSQFCFLGKDLLGFSDYHSFKKTYAVLSNLGDKTFERWVFDPTLRRKVKKSEPIQIVVGYRDVDDLNRRIEPLSFRVLKKDCLDLPEKIYQKWPVEMSDEQKKLYKELKEKLIIEVAGKTITAPMAMTLMMRHRQLLGGFPGGEALKTNPRLDALLTWAEPFVNTAKAIIWAVFKPEIKAITAKLQETFGRASTVEYHGDVNNEHRAHAIERFQTNPTCRFFVANQATAGRGLTLTAASQVGYYTNDWSFEDRKQSEDRAHRIGQINKVTYTDFHTPGTVEDRVFDVLRGKAKMSAIITGDELISWI